MRPVEQPVNLDDDIDAYYWPFLISGLVGVWDLTDEQAAKLREYLLRGGFLLCDSFYGTAEWEGFVAGIRRVFPDRPIVDLARQPSDLSLRLRSDRSAADSDLAAPAAAAIATTAPSRAGARSSTTTSASWS